MAISFDGPNRLMTLSSGTTVLSVPDCYSRWKDWVLAGNAQYPIAFDGSGGEPIDPAQGTYKPYYDYLLNGWRIRPQEADHTLSVVGGVLLVYGGGDPFVSTLGGYTVRINYQQPVQAIMIASGGGAGATPEEIANAVWSRALEGGLATDAALRIMLAALSGATQNSAGTWQYKGVDGTTDRITVTIDAQKNRANIVLDGQ